MRGVQGSQDRRSDEAEAERSARCGLERESEAARAVLDRVLKAHETWFDVTRTYEFAGRTFAGYAEFHSEAEQYVLVKRAKLWGVNTHEYLFFDVRRRLDADAFAELVRFMTTEALAKVSPNPEHMTSYVSLVVVADEVAPDLDKPIRRTRFRKNFQLGLQGWADLRVAVIDLARTTVITNARGEELRATLCNNAEAALGCSFDQRKRRTTSQSARGGRATHAALDEQAARLK
ncbi:hypothetical protein [Xiamenia xianingshaonis]|uniref:DUF8052 domain-containing protein n=1 Tax=Xiamenia xianingshaonis TaxID=2682776 RepID=A0A9E6MQC8_9ACTN|nr:hypothetical protein [Xiamenia xianingshaonis]NHM13457.1 hypothetical protein [Xiamenia xianingshaonis]QTU84467.1 hypothetical protein J7S26_00585 [Xiamenia xianingshaonis]